MQLRQFQETQIINPAREALRHGGKSVVCTAPTGAGKTACSAYMAQQMSNRGLRVLCIVHKDTIRKQMMETYHSFGVPRGQIVSGGNITRHPVQIAMIGTLINRLDEIPTPDAIMIDECHHCTESNSWGRAINHYKAKNPALITIGYTATPQGRTDGKGLWPFFDSIIQGPSMENLVRDGWLVYPKTMVGKETKNMDFHITRGDYDLKEQQEKFGERKVIGDIIESYRQHLDGCPIIVSCAGLKHAAEVANRYESAARDLGKDWKAVMVQGGKKYQKQLFDAINGMANGSVQIVTFSDVFGEGVDVPVCSGIQMLRKTKSLVLYLQFIGRALRPLYPPGFDQYTSTAAQRLDAIARSIKPVAHVQDFAGNSLEHGHPISRREWGLHDTKEKGKTAGMPMPQTTMCESCLGIWPGKPRTCPDCGADLVAQAMKAEGKKLPKEIEGELVELLPDGTPADIEQLVTQALRFQDLDPAKRQKAMLSELYRNGPDRRVDALRQAIGYKKGWTETAWQRIGRHR